MQPQGPEEVVLDDEKVEEDAVGVPCDTANDGPCNGVENKVVGRGDDGGEDEGGVGQAGGDDGGALPGPGAEGVQGKRGDGEADEEGIAKVKRGHGG